MTEAEEKALEHIVGLVGSLCGHPMTHEVSSTPKTRIITLHLDKRDRGRVIGSGGRIFESFRTVCRALSGKYGTRILIEIDEEEIK